MTTKMRPASDMSMASTWRFEEGRLTIYHLGEKVSLGRYATREHAARAAAVYFEKHGAAVKATGAAVAAKLTIG